MVSCRIYVNIILHKELRSYQGHISSSSFLKSRCGKKLEIKNNNNNNSVEV